MMPNSSIWFLLLSYHFLLLENQLSKLDNMDSNQRYKKDIQDPQTVPLLSAYNSILQMPITIMCDTSNNKFRSLSAIRLNPNYGGLCKHIIMIMKFVNNKKARIIISKKTELPGRILFNECHYIKQT